MFKIDKLITPWKIQWGSILYCKIFVHCQASTIGGQDLTQETPTKNLNWKLNDILPLLTSEKRQYRDVIRPSLFNMWAPDSGVLRAKALQFVSVFATDKFNKNITSEDPSYSPPLPGYL